MARAEIEVGGDLGLQMSGNWHMMSWHSPESGLEIKPVILGIKETILEGLSLELV